MLLLDASSFRLIFNSFLSDLMASPMSISSSLELFYDIFCDAQNVHYGEDDIFFCPRFNSFDDSPFVRDRNVAFPYDGNDLFLSVGSDVTLLDAFNDFVFVHIL